MKLNTAQEVLPEGASAGHHVLHQEHLWADKSNRHISGFLFCAYQLAPLRPHAPLEILRYGYGDCELWLILG
ncbi:hypothetical protein, partial [Bradyrhizobium liaoningense]|uniref:hypothetical protein n=1 Tax=Bradyrhizobium liaoningense TaxID=43992 RepID=UPI001AEC2840